MLHGITEVIMIKVAVCIMGITLLSRCNQKQLQENCHRTEERLDQL
jgi:hypothetical protein